MIHQKTRTNFVYLSGSTLLDSPANALLVSLLVFENEL